MIIQVNYEPNTQETYQSSSSLPISENSAFQPISKEQNIIGKDLGTFRSRRKLPPLIRPIPSRKPPILTEEKDSTVYKRIKSRARERSSSAVEISVDDPISPELRQERKTQPLPRSNDFHKILQRFRSAEHTPLPIRREPSPRSPSPLSIDEEMRVSPIAVPNELWSPIRDLRHRDSSGSHGSHRGSREGSKGSQESRGSRGELGSSRSSSSRDLWSRNSRTSTHSPFTNSRAQSRSSALSLRSPLCFLPNKAFSPKPTPSPSLVPQRMSGTSTPSEEGPQSHTGSTPEPQPQTAFQKRLSLPTRWVKETDIDEPESLPSRRSSLQQLHVSNGQLNASPMGSGLAVAENPAKPMSRLGGSCRRQLNGVVAETRPQPTGVYVRRSRSREVLSPNSGDSRGSAHNVPIFVSNESISQTKNSSISEDHGLEHIFQQMALSHVQTLTAVADRIPDQLRIETPVSKNRLSSLSFRSFMVESQPVLTKGKTLFYNSSLPRPNMPSYDVTLMIAPISHYAPLMRRGDAALFSVPGFAEIEDHDGEIKRFLRETGTQNLDGRNVKAVAMPRLHMCSFHSLAAQGISQRTFEQHEELVCFLLIQLLVALKNLQSEGVEALSANFKEFLLAYRFPPSELQTSEFPRLIFLADTLGAELEGGNQELVGLCRYALRALCTLLHCKMDGRAPHLRFRSRYSRPLQACANMLEVDKSNSLTKAKNVLELAMWWREEAPKMEIDTRSYIDLARARCVDELLRQLVLEPGCRLGAMERLKIEFLLAATPRGLIESHAAIVAAHLS